MAQQNGRTTNDRRRGEDIEHYGGGQSGYGSGRYGEDRSMGPGYRNQSYGGHQYDDRQGMHTDDRFTGRGGEGYWEDRAERMGPREEGHWTDRTERSGYNSGYNQGGMGYGAQGDGGMQRDMQREMQQREMQRSPQGFRGGSGGAQIFEESGGRWAHVPQAGMSTDWGRMQDDYNRGYGGMRQGPYERGGNVGQPMVGGHRGKGPQGYTRSDDRIREQVCEALSDDDHVDATHIEVVVKNGEVILTGTVEDRRQKRLAEDAIEHLPGVRDVQNQLRCGTNRGNQSSGSAVGRNETEMSSDKKHRA